MPKITHQNMSNGIRFTRTLSFVALCFSLLGASISQAADAGITYQGRILKPNGDPLSGTTVQFRMQIRTPGAQNCLMFEELHVQDLSTSNGNFSLTINDGNGNRTDSSTYGLDRIFANRGTFTFNPATCTSGSNYTPNEEDGRKLVVFFKDETMGSFEQMPAQNINFVPLALESKQVQGFTAASLVRVQEPSGGALGNIAPLSNANYTELLALIGGTTLQYEKAGKLLGSTVPSMTSGHTLGWNGSAWTSVDPLAGVQAFAKTALPACAAGAYIRNNAGALECTTPVIGGMGTVTEVRTGTGLTGGPINSDGEIALATLNAGGTGFKVTYDTYGRVTAAVALVEADIPQLSTAGKVVGSAITSGTIGGSTAINTTGTITSGAITSTGAISASGLVSSSSGSFTALGTQSLQVFETTNNFKVSIIANSATGNYTLTLPPSAGANGQVLTTNGSGVLSWTSPSSGSVTSLTGDVTSTGSGAVATTIANSAVTFAKMQNVPTASIVGRYSAGSGAPESLTVGTGLALSGAGVLSSTITDTDTFATTLGACANGTVPLRVAGAWTCGVPTPLSTNSALVQRDGTGNFAANVVTMNGLALNNAGSIVNLVNLAGSAYTLTMPVALGTSGQVLGTSGSGQLTWTTPAAPGTGDFKADGTVPMTGNLRLNGNYLSGDGGSEGIAVDAGGNVGVGTTSPNGKLDVKLATNQHLNFIADTNGTYPGAAGILAINDANSAYTPMGLFASGFYFGGGSVGIGTTPSGTALLEMAPGSTIKGYSNVIMGTGTTLPAWSGNAEVNNEAGIGLHYRALSMLFDVGSSGGTPAAPIYPGTLTLSSYGSVGVGTTGPGAKLDVKGDFRLSGSSSGFVGFQVPAAAGSTTYTWPTAPTNGYVLSTNGSGVLSWVAASAGTVTSLTGDVTSTGTGAIATTIANGAVTTGKILDGTIATADIANDNVTFAKIQNVPTASIAGRFTAGTGDLESLTLGTGLALSGAGVLSSTITDTDTFASTLGACANGTVPLRAGGVWTCGVPTPLNTASALVQRDASGNFAASVITANGLALNNSGSLVNIVNPSGAAYTLTLPTAVGTSGQVLSTSGSGTLTWANQAAGGAGDFKADGSVPMTGNLQMGANSVVTQQVIAPPATTVGRALTLAASDAATSGNNGGSLLLNAGSPVAYTNGDGGNVVVTPGSQGGTGNGGAFTVNAGAGAGGGRSGGAINLNGGGGPAGGFGGSINLTAGNAAGAGGNIVLTAGTGGTAGIINLKSETRLAGSSSGYVGFAAPAAAGSTTYTWPSAPTNGYVLSTNGTGALSWVAAASGTVTSLTGDVTSTGTGAVATTIANDAVTFAKIQNIPTASLIGRYTAATGDPESITLGAGLALNTGTGVLSNTVTDTDTFASTLGACANGTVPLRAAGAWTCGVPTPLSTNSAIVQRDGTGNFAANVITMNGAALNNAGSVVNLVNLAGSAYTLTMPVGVGTNGQVLGTSGSGQLTWTTPSGGGSGDFKADGSVSMTGAFKGTSGTVALPGISSSADASTGFRITSGSVNMSMGGINTAQLSSSAWQIYAPLQIGNGSAATPEYAFSGANNKGMYNAGTDILGFSTAGTQRMAIDAAGKVGIGTGSPYQKLDVHGTNEDVHIGIQNNSSTAARYPGVLVQNYTGGFGGAPTFTGLASRGNSGSPAPVQANDTLFALNGLGATNTSYGSGTGAFIQMTAAETFSPTAFGTNISFSNVANGTTTLQNRMFIRQDGNVGIGTTGPTQKLEVNGNVLATAYMSTSDRRLKKDFVALDHSLEKLVKLNTVKFRWITPANPEADREQIGLIAQDVREVYPQAVTEDVKGILRVNYMALIAPMIDGLRDLYHRAVSTEAKTAELEKQVADLKAKNQNLEDRLLRIEQSLSRVPASAPKSK